MSKNRNNIKEFRSIAGGLPVKYWLKVFGGSLLVVLGASSAIIKIFRLYETPTTSNDFYWRIIPLVLLLILSISAIATLIPLAVHYRRRYRIERDRAMVRDLYPDRTNLQGRYGEILAKARRQAIIIGISLHTLTTDRNFQEWIQTALSNNKELNIHLIYQKPYSEIISQKEKEENRPLGRISQDCIANINKALRVKKAIGDIGKRLHIQVIENLVPIAFMFLWDDELYFEPYLSREIGRTCPTFVMRKNEFNEKVFNVFWAYAKGLIERTPEKTDTEARIRHLHTDFGRDKSREIIKQAIFLDRDGVIVRDQHYISKPQDLELLSGVVPLLKKLQKSFRLIVVTNQSGVARGLFTEEDLQTINNELIEMLHDHGVGLDAIYYCPHHPDFGLEGYKIDCECRKPKPGLLHLAAQEFNLNLENSFLIGDKDSDIEAGHRAGVKTIRLGEDAGTLNTECKADYSVKSINEVESIIK